MKAPVLGVGRKAVSSMQRRRVIAALAVFSLWALAATRVASAAWPSQGRAVSIAPNSQTHSATTTDGAGGAIVVWQDERDPKVNLFAHHLLASGDLDPAWPVNGRAVLANLVAVVAGGNFRPVIASDGSGGAIV